MQDTTWSIISNQPVAPDTRLLTLAGQLESWSAGQFVMLQVSPSLEPFLRRPLAILGYEDGELQLLYKIAGRGTRLLADQRKGAQLSLLGPLGRGFRLPAEREEAILVAGGTGLPPMLALLARLERARLILGTREAAQIPGLDLLKDTRVRHATEDGSRGFQGLATELLEVEFASSSENCMVYACGPAAMLAEVARLAQDRGLACQVSLEERMGCGFGVCAGCVVGTQSGNQRVCREGPVFDAREIMWGALR